MYGSQATSKDLNLPFPVSPFNKQGKDGYDLDHHHEQQRQQMSSSGLLRYRSAPSTLLGEVCEDFLPHRSSSPEAAEIMFARLMSPDHLRDHQIGGEKPPPAPPASAGGQRSPQFMLPAAAMEHEASEVVHQQGGAFSSVPASQLLYHSQQPQQRQVGSHSSVATTAMESSYRVVNSMAMEHEEVKGGANCSNLIRHSSSPAGLFSHMNVDNGYAVMRGMGGFRAGAGSNGETAALGGSRLKGQISFSSRQGSSAGLMSQISEIGSEGIGGSSSPEDNGMGNGNGNGRCYIPGFPVASWDDSSLLPDSISGIKRARDGGLNLLEAQNGDVRNHVSGLSHQFSLPKTSSEIAAMEKYLQFQDSVPCKIRAKRGCATHPRSIAERVRRTRISERMRKLQELVPNMDKQTNTADMLDLAVEYIKDLQKQVENFSESQANCNCSGK